MGYLCYKLCDTADACAPHRVIHALPVLRGVQYSLYLCRKVCDAVDVCATRCVKRYM